MADLKIEKHTFWCRWEAPYSIPESHMVSRWPRGMKAWISGQSVTAMIWCARVDAVDPEHAERVIRGCYGKSGGDIEFSWEPKKNDLGWRPTGGRFPE